LKEGKGPWIHHVAIKERSSAAGIAARAKKKRNLFGRLNKKGYSRKGEKGLNINNKEKREERQGESKGNTTMGKIRGGTREIVLGPYERTNARGPDQGKKGGNPWKTSLGNPGNNAQICLRKLGEIDERGGCVEEAGGTRGRRSLVRDKEERMD